MKAKPTLAVVPATKTAGALVPGIDFSGVRKALAEFHATINRAAVWQILIGEELRRLKVKFDIRNGGDRKSESHSETLISWDSLLAAEVPGLSRATAFRYMALAEAAKKNLAPLRKQLAANAPAEKLVATLQKATGGKSARELLAEWSEDEEDETAGDEGSTRKVHALGGGKGGKKATTEEANAQLRLETWQHLRSELGAEFGLSSYADLPTVELEQWLVFLPRLTAALNDTMKARKVGKGGAK